MRRSLRLMLLPVLALPAWTISIEAARAAEPAPPAAAPAHQRAHHVRQTWEDRFAAANVAHDGHLTLAEAKTGYGLVAKHFDDIDADHKGYVTQNDMRAWHIMKKAAHRLTKSPHDATKPHDSMQRAMVDPATLPVQTVAVLSDSLPASTGVAEKP